MRKKYLLLLILIGLVAILSGCTEIDQPITSESEGIWNTIFVYPLSWVIINIAETFNNSYGLSIIIVTIIIRLILMPLNIKQLKSSKAMQEVQPLLKEVQTKYSSKDQKTQQKLQEETMKIMKEHNVNPLAGCLPILIQMPIMLAIFHAIRRTSEINSYSFLWFELGSPDPYYILPILTAGFTFLQQKLMMSTNSSVNSNPQMAMQMKMMLYMMPIMIGVTAIFFPAALALYWVTGNIFMVIQTLLINKPMMSSTGGDKK
ncbi:OxaA precursor [Oceanobacillus arenosus]|uniref:Membrane protein insertase YidC n=1 Tax=Oceanobacillus arenosus TaxID=1229153 RepID=A0A3D8PJ33_9BACI|nr:membrane protein insertase YidC [Oceanobacillus arenosus]RDW15249.1 OxaA precursor [Oceanobacillus arenosus]